MQKTVALAIGWSQRRIQRRGRTFLLAAIAAAALSVPAMSSGQPSAAMRKTVAQTKAQTAHKRKTAHQKSGVPANKAQTVAIPPAPPKPQWPVNDPPEKASVTWSAQGLRIDARNSSLQQILHQVSEEAGIKIQGMDKDERVFGVYGPGQARDVLARLLEGSDYNVLMVGNGKGGAPQQIVLSVKPAGEPEPNAPVAQSDMYVPPITPYQPPMPPQPVMQRNEPPRTPQQILQEMEQRQQQMREQMQRQQQQ